ncbi:MAG: hypothetical protein HUK20_03425 [Fibrobacter sp.]|nr:hypothetical protein [Fibrobacter sp.]
MRDLKKHLKNICCTLCCALIFGCTITHETGSVDWVKPIVDDAEYAAKKVQELKETPMGRPLVEGYEKFVSLQKTKDTTLSEPMRLSRRAFFEGWKQKSDSLCKTLDTSNALALEIRAMYQAVLKKDVEDGYDYALRQMDSLHYDIRKDAPFEDKVKFMKSITDSLNMSHFFVAKNKVHYQVTAAKNIKQLLKQDDIRAKSGEYKTVDMACMDSPPMEEETLILTDEYSTMLDAFMGVNGNKENYHPERFLKFFYLRAAIPVMYKHWGGGYHYNSFPIISSIFFNANYTQAVMNVMSSFSSGGYYTLEKKDGVWKAIESHATWIM